MIFQNPKKTLKNGKIELRANLYKKSRKKCKDFRSGLKSNYDLDQDLNQKKKTDLNRNEKYYEVK